MDTLEQRRRQHLFNFIRGDLGKEIFFSSNNLDVFPLTFNI